ncbi:MAG: beta-N-acetylhexosaminidase [Bacteroidales bacterium]|nr:beta-N-acetylhexosaminidase [Bacteroidales bacterium]
MKKTLATMLIMAALTSCGSRVTTVMVIPEPASVSLSGKTVAADALLSISAPSDLALEAQVLADGLSREAGMECRMASRGRVRLSIDGSMGEEECGLKVSRHSVVLRGGSAKAVYYGVQTMLQELRSYDGCLMCGTIKDSPRYAWRGFMVDESRHFFGEEKIRQTLDMMASCKLNRFHWHLTDAPGWRIEIKSHPELTSIGSIGCHTDPEAPSAFYTQEQIRDIVAYAAERHIDVVPEIDMPGHASSATRAYPELAAGDAGSFTYNPGKPEVYSFLRDVLSEVAGLFPYEYLHIGGDEVFMGSGKWAEDPYIKALMEREDIADIKGVEAYFLRQIAPVVDSLGRKMTAWDDILELGSGKCGETLTWWRQERPDHLYQGLRDGYELILCPRLPLYFDFVQDETHTSGRRWKGGVFCPMDSVYVFPDRILDAWGDAEASQDGILGIQANLWSEVVRTMERYDFMTYPRIFALAEAAWTSADNKDFESFSKRLEPIYELMDELGIFYCDYRDISKHPEPKI